jgi:glycosyltransferase involved in cell wall biosynthesis
VKRKEAMKHKTRVAHLTSVHSPDDIRIFHKECKTLVRAGYEVVLIVPHERDEEIDGVFVRAVSRPADRFGRMTGTMRSVYRAAMREDAEVCHFHDPELIPAAMLLKTRGRKVIYDVHEDVPRQILNKQWLPPAARRAVGGGAALAEAIGAKCFHGIVAATPAIAPRFSVEKTVIVQNFPILGELARQDAVPYSERPHAVAYVGGIAALRGIREMVRALPLLPDVLDARLVLAGRFSPAELETDVCAMPGWGRVNFLGWQSRAGVASILGRVRAGLVLFHPVPNHVNAQPNKLFEYMSAGIPVIASDFPLWREMVEDVGCGLLVDPHNSRAIGDAISWILEHPREAEAMGLRGEEAVKTRYNWSVESEKLLAFYEKLLNVTNK